MKKTALGIFCFALAACVATSGISASPLAANAAETDNSVAETYTSSTLLSNEPTVVYDVTDAAALQKLTSGTEKPSNAILRFQEDYNIVGENGEVIDAFTEIYSNVLKGSIIPILRVETEAEANALVSFLKEELSILDMAVMSSDPALVKTVRSSAQSIRGIIEYDETATDAFSIVTTTNSNLANVAVIPQSLATYDFVEYIHARFKTVWVRADSTDEIDIFDAIGSGAYGVVSTDYSAVYDALDEYDASGVARMPFNVAHRGLPNEYNENSVAGTKAAIEQGATHVELDGYYTTDGQIAMMHDDSINRTSDGTGYIESMTLEQVQSYHLDLFEPQEKIPSLGDILDAIYNEDIVLVFEIKSQQTAIVNALKTTVEAKNEEYNYNFWEQIVVISFYLPILNQMKSVLPEVPTAYLYATDNLTSMISWLSAYNTGLDANYGYASETYNEQLRDRGFIGWYWTYDSFKRMTEGYVGLTNNAANNSTRLARKINIPAESLTAESVSVGDSVDLTITNYKGSEVEVTGTIFKAYDTGGGVYRVIAKVDYLNVVMYSQAFTITATKTTATSVSLSSSATEAAEGESVTVTASVTPSDAETENIVWYVNGVETDADGLTYTLNAGEGTYTVSCTIDGVASNEITITINAAANASPADDDGGNTGLIIGVAAGCCVLIAAVAVIVILLNKKRKNGKNG